jgi:hypothetical protein
MMTIGYGSACYLLYAYTIQEFAYVSTNMAQKEGGFGSYTGTLRTSIVNRNDDKTTFILLHVYLVFLILMYFGFLTF